jgi:hypothetical protein
VVDVGRRVAADLAVDGEVVAEADDFDVAVLLPQTLLDAARPPHDLARVERDLLARREAREREATLPVDAAIPDF